MSTSFVAGASRVVPMWCTFFLFVFVIVLCAPLLRCQRPDCPWGAAPMARNRDGVVCLAVVRFPSLRSSMYFALRLASDLCKLFVVFVFLGTVLVPMRGKVT